MPLTILQVGYPLAETGPDAVGGAEQVLALCDRAAVEAGHRSLVIAPEGSRTAGELIPLPAVPEALDDAAVQAARRACADALAAHLDRADVVHMHGVDFWRYLPAGGPPVLVTLHLPPSYYPAGVLPPERPDTWLVAVSRAQRRSFDGALRLLRVDNGVDLTRYRPDDAVGDYVLALGRLCPEKGYDLALEAARRAERPLVLAGGLYGYDTHRSWFETEIRPRLDERRRFVGAVGGEAKRRLLARARCVVVPSQVPETSSLVAMEALACGTPVVAWSHGALPDVVEHGVTGLLVGDVDELVSALDHVERIDRRACREAAGAFCSGRTGAGYLELYGHLARPVADPPRVEVVDGIARLAELPWDDLHARCPGAGPFLRRGWLLPWARTFSPELRCLALWRGDRLDGLLPLHLYEGSLVPLGHGVSDRHDALLAGCDRFGDAARLLDAVAALDGWCRCELTALPQDSPLRYAPVPAHLDDVVEADEVSPSLSLEPGSHWSRVPKRLRANLRTVRNRVGRDHRAAWVTARGPDLDASLDLLFALHGARWRDRGQGGVFTEALVRRHLREACHALDREGVVRLHVLHLDDRPAAALLGLLDGGRLHYYISGFDPRFRKLSPGTLTIAHALDAAAAEGATTLDMLRGGEPYKYAWGAVDRPLYRRVLRRGTGEDASG